MQSSETGTLLAPAAPAALQASGLSFRYGAEQALDDVSITLPTGRFAALIGANGAGKTTLYSILSGLFAPAAGTVSVLGHDLTRQPSRALARLGIVFQRPTLDGDLNVQQNLRYFADLQGLPRRDAAQRIDEALQRHDIESLALRRASSLSGGQRRRVELARSLLHEPALLLMDEATVGLDMPSRREFIEHVHALVDEVGVSVLWSTHLADEIGQADTVHLLDKGRLLDSGPLTALLERHDATDIESLTRILRQAATTSAGQT